MAEIMSRNPRVQFSVRFYDEEPLLRTYFFFSPDNQVEALLGVYRYDADEFMEFIGAEQNYLMRVQADSELGTHLVDVFRSRFEYGWAKASPARAVIFDLDGVLVNSMPFYERAWTDAFKTVGIEIEPKEVYLRESQKAAVTATELYLSERGTDPPAGMVDTLVSTMRQRYDGYFDVSFFPAVFELLDMLKARGIKLALVTGSPALPQKLRDKTDFIRYFDEIITGKDTKNGKPSPEPYVAAVDRLGIDPKDCYVVENSPLGIQSAVAAKLTCLAVRNNSPLTEVDLSEAGASLVCRDMAALRRHLVWVDTNMSLMHFLDTFPAVRLPRASGRA
jgi:beta-phosphoglucomutase